MSDEEEEREVDQEGVEGEEGEGGDNKKRMIIIIAGAVVLLLGVGAGLFFSGILGGGKDEAAAEHSEDGHDGEHGDGYGEDKHGDDHGDGKDDGHGKKDKKGKKDKAKGDDHGKDKGEGKGDKSKSAFMEIPTMNISLNSDGGPPRYLRLSVQLELNDPADSAAIEAIMPRVIDKFQTYLRELRVKDLRGSGGIYRLQTELLWRVNQAAAPLEVKDVLFQEILIQ